MALRPFRLLAVCLLLAALPQLAQAQSSDAAPGDTTAAEPAPKPAPQPAPAAKQPSRVYFGGSLGFSAWSNYMSIRVEPMVGYKLSPKASLGARVTYEYYKDKRVVPNRESHSYGGSVYSRYRIIPQAYAHAEFAYMSYDWTGERDWVPYLLLGGGYSQPLAGKSYFLLEVLFDVIQDSGSPYKDWEPRVSAGVVVGF